MTLLSKIIIIEAALMTIIHESPLKIIIGAVLMTLLSKSQLSSQDHYHWGSYQIIIQGVSSLLSRSSSSGSFQMVI